LRKSTKGDKIKNDKKSDKIAKEKDRKVLLLCKSSFLKEK
jgi:hypothetical protein